MPEHVAWLQENYSTMNNIDLVDQLNDMVRQANEIRIEQLQSILNDVTQSTVKKSIMKEIAWRKTFKGINVAYVKNVARRLKCKKNKTLLASSGVARARITNIKRWLKKAKWIEQPYAWLQTFRANETRTCIVNSTSDINAIRNATKAYNKNDSCISGFHFSTEVIKEADIMRVKAVPNSKED